MLCDGTSRRAARDLAARLRHNPRYRHGVPVFGSKSKGIRPANTITPEKRRQAATLVRTGESVSLSHDLITGGGSGE